VLYLLDKVACQKDCKEYSIEEMGNYAHDFMTNTLGIHE